MWSLALQSLAIYIQKQDPQCQAFSSIFWGVGGAALSKREKAHKVVPLAQKLPPWRFPDLEGGGRILNHCKSSSQFIKLLHVHYLTITLFIQ